MRISPWSHCLLREWLKLIEVISYSEVNVYHQSCPQPEVSNILTSPPASPSSSHLHPGLLLLGEVPAGCNRCKVLDDALRVHSLPCPRFSAGERKHRRENYRPTFCWRRRAEWWMYLRDQDGLIFTICQGKITAVRGAVGQRARSQKPRAHQRARNKTSASKTKRM